MGQIFVSYHFASVEDPRNYNGFGNWVGEFDENAYQDDPANFIISAQNEVARQLEGKLGFPVQIKILFFR